MLGALVRGKIALLSFEGSYAISRYGRPGEHTRPRIEQGARMNAEDDYRRIFSDPVLVMP